MPTDYATIRVDREIRDRLRSVTTKDLTYSKFIEQMLDHREIHKDV